MAKNQNKESKKEKKKSINSPKRNKKGTNKFAPVEKLNSEDSFNIQNSNGIHLDWSLNYFGGRESELNILREAVKAPTNGKNTPGCRIFFVQGETGIGKTYLVEEAFRNTESPSVLASAKFDDSQATTPLQAWVDATSSLLEKMVHDDDFRIHMYKSFQLSSEASADYLSILTSIPLLGERLREYFEVRPSNYRGMVTSKKSKESFRSFETPKTGGASKAGMVMVPDIFKTTTERSSTVEKDHSFERLKLGYRELYRVFCQYITVVLFMDDIQWGEPDDYKIVDTILDDPFLEERLIFVAAHRPVSMVHGLNLVKKPGTRYCKTITLGPMAPSEISEMLHKLLKRDDDDVVEIVTELRDQTNGNPFFIVQLLKVLEDKGLLYHSLVSRQWEWDLEKVKKKTSISDNALELVSQKMKKKKLEKVLGYAAILGSTRISITVLMWILEEEMDEAKSEGDLNELMEMAHTMGFVNRLGRKEYQFAHDRIREGALTLLPAGEKLARLHLKLGLRLRSLWENESDNDTLLFQLVTQLNAGKELIKTSKERYRLAQLNFQTAEAAILRSAFYPAVHFLRRTKDLLIEQEYEVDTFDFILQTETALARMEYCCGLLDKTITRADVILKIARQDKDKAVALHLKALCRMQQRKPEECLEVAIEGLSVFGVQYPRRFFKIQLLRLQSNAKKILKNLTDEEILNLPKAEDERSQLASECLPLIGEMAHTYGYRDHLTCCMLTAIPLSIEKGRNSMTAQTLVAWGCILSEEGEIAEAYRFGRLGLQMAEERIGGILDDRAISFYYQWIHHLRHPYADGVEPYSEALKALWARGSLEGVVMGTGGHLRHKYLAGTRLGPLLKDMRHFRNLCTDFGMEMARSLINPFAQMVLNLVEGPCEDMLRGEFMLESQSIRFWRLANSKIGVHLYYFYKMVIAYYFNAYNMAGNLAAKVTRMFLEGADNIVPYRFFFRGLAAWTAYGLTKRPKYRKLARRMTAHIQNLVDASVINCEHSLLFLKAERLAALSRGRDRNEVQKAFDEAIVTAARRGYLYDHALANERAGQYFKKIDDKDWASTYLQRARDSYVDWGAQAKAYQMRREYWNLLKEEPPFHSRESIESSRTSQQSENSYPSQIATTALNPRGRISSLTTQKLETVESGDFDEESDRMGSESSDEE